MKARGFVLMPVVLLLSLVAAMAFLGNRETALAGAATDDASDQDKARYAAEAGLHHAIFKMHTTGCGGTYPIILLSPVQDTAFDGGKYYAYGGAVSGSPVTIYSTGTYGDASVTLTRAGVPMHQATSFTMTLQPDATAGIDTYLKNSGSTGFGTSTDINMSVGGEYPLIRFDLSAIPAGAHVTSATLGLWATAAGNAGTAAVHRVQRDWTEAAAWTTSDGTTAWSVAGGDFHSSAVATATLAGANAWTNWDITALADDWVKGSAPNQGVELQAVAGVNSWLFASSDATTASQRPKLTVTFLPPCGWVPPATTVTLSPTADAEAYSPSPTNNYGTSTQIWVSSSGGGIRTLLSFNTTGIAPGKTVTSAKLRLYLASMSVTKVSKNLSLEVHELTEVWTELGATWNNRIAGTAWSVPGAGSYRPSADATLTLVKDTTAGQWLEFDVTALAQEWVDGVTPNRGLIVVNATSAADVLKFSAREASNNPPELVVTYQ